MNLTQALAEVCTPILKMSMNKVLIAHTQNYKNLVNNKQEIILALEG